MSRLYWEIKSITIDSPFLQASPCLTFDPLKTSSNLIITFRCKSAVYFKTTPPLFCRNDLEQWGVVADPSLAVTTAGDPRTTICRVVIYLQRDMSADSCLPQCHTQSEIHTSHPSPLVCPKTRTCSYRGAVGLGNKYVGLNVGGNLFYTTVQVLTRENSMLKAMFSGKLEVFTDKEGELSQLVNYLTF